MAVLLLDGGMGHELKTRITPAFQEKFFLAGNLANTEQPELVVALHQEYLQAGAQVLTTNSFVSVPSILERFGLQGQLPELIANAGKCARKAVENHVALGGHAALVAGCLPPLTDCYLSHLVGDVEEMEAVYGTIVQLLEPHVDLFLCETLSTSREAVAAVNAVSRWGVGKHAWVAWTIEDTLSANLRGGESVAEAVLKLTSQTNRETLKAVLFNCCVPQAITAALPVLRACLPDSIQIGGYANAFQESTSAWLSSADAVEYVRGAPMRKASEVPCLTIGEDYGEDELLNEVAAASHSRNWIMNGATIVGGCCGTLPKHTLSMWGSIQTC